MPLGCGESPRKSALGQKATSAEGGGMSALGQKSTSRIECPRSAPPPIADIDRLLRNVRLVLPAQPVDATHALNLSAGVSNCKVSRGRSLS